tara:strand:- start:1858 stop:2544 length:687 start_codon:yes stop_codon:yes gene_type:complete
MAGLVVETAETQFAITLAELKEHVKVEDTSDDTVLTIIQKAAHNWAKQYTQRSLTTQTLQLFIDSVYPKDKVLQEGLYLGVDLDLTRRGISLPFSPVSSISSVKSFDDDDTAKTFSSSKYHLDEASYPSKLVLKNGENFPTGTRAVNAIRIQYVAGYGASSAVPQDIKSACLIYGAYLYEHRGDRVFSGNDHVQSVPYTATQLLQPYRTYNLGRFPYEGTHVAINRGI